MQVSVTFVGILRDRLGRKTLHVELPAAATCRDLLDAVAPIVEDRLAGWAWDRRTRSFSGQVTVARNLSVQRWDDSAVLEDGEEILVLPPMAGG
jgi:molybdopterin converting factor small subunit